MADAGLFIADEMEILARVEVDVDQRVLLIRQAAAGELAVEADEQAVVQTGRKARALRSWFTKHRFGLTKPHPAE